MMSIWLLGTFINSSKEKKFKIVSGGRINEQLIKNTDIYRELYKKIKSYDSNIKQHISCNY